MLEVFTLKPGVVRLNLADDQNQYLAVGGGFLVVQPDQTTVLARSAERPEEIDSARAERAKERAVARLANKTGVIDEPRAAAAFQRALESQTQDMKQWPAHERDAFLAQ